MANNNPNTKGLKKFTKLDRDRSVKAGRKGGKNSQKVQKEKKEQRKFGELLALALSTTIKREKLKKSMEKNFPDLPQNYKGYFISTLMDRLKLAPTLETKDLIKLFETVRNSIGEKPKDNFGFNPIVNIIVDSKKKKALMDKI